jgi:NAD(P)-dependent dehydrogenase (short-subunit alcohol dehydrogenase family)
MRNCQTVIITGANRGIGKETARRIVSDGHKVILACRNPSLAEVVKNELVKDTGNENIFVLELDLSSRSSIDSFVKNFAEQHKALNILINNAGISSSKSPFNSDGFETIVSTNFIGTYLLTTKLLPYFDASQEKRIVILTSNIQAIGSFQTKKINKYRWFKAYAVSKRMLLLFAKWLSAEKEQDGFKINAIHPGIVKTSIMFTGKWFDPLIRAICNPFFIEPAEGAKASCDLALHEVIPNGKYYIKGVEHEIPVTRRRDKEMKDLMQFCKSLST